MQKHLDTTGSDTTACEWQRYVAVFLSVFGGAAAALYAFILLIDPYDIVPFSVPMERKIVSISQRYMYPQIVRSKRFDSVIIGTSTSRLIDPEILNNGFGGKFANLAMDSMTAWEQAEVANFFLRQVGAPKALVVGLDGVWCDQNADINRVTPRGFPDWLYDDNAANDYPYLLNFGTLEIAGRMAGNKLGLYRERIRSDGFGVFVPPEDQYNLERAQSHIWPGNRQTREPIVPPVLLTEADRRSLKFPALNWLEAILKKLPATTDKILVFMPVHVAAQPQPGSRLAAVEEKCKRRIIDLGRTYAAVVADWRIPTTLTTTDSNYWDPLHYRLPIANEISRAIAGPIREGKLADNGVYRLLGPE